MTFDHMKIVVKPLFSRRIQSLILLEMPIEPASVKIDNRLPGIRRPTIWDSKFPSKAFSFSTFVKTATATRRLHLLATRTWRTRGRWQCLRGIHFLCRLFWDSKSCISGKWQKTYIYKGFCVVFNAGNGLTNGTLVVPISRGHHDFTPLCTSAAGFEPRPMASLCCLWTGFYLNSDGVFIYV